MNDISNENFEGFDESYVDKPVLVWCETGEEIPIPESILKPYRNGEENPDDASYLIISLCGFLQSYEKKGRFALTYLSTKVVYNTDNSGTEIESIKLK